MTKLTNVYTGLIFQFQFDKALDGSPMSGKYNTINYGLSVGDHPRPNHLHLVGVGSGRLGYENLANEVTDQSHPFARDGSLMKFGIFCYTGVFEGMFGPIIVTDDLILKMADDYNTKRAVPQNDNDFAPVLVDHIRAADLTMGRLLNGLLVFDWKHPETGETVKALGGWLRIDDSDAIAKVESGKYAHLSISFDEETGEIFEISFVAVEAARRAIALALAHSNTSTGDINMSKELQASLDKSNLKLKSLKNLAKKKYKNVNKRISALSAQAATLKATLGTFDSFMKNIEAEIKTSSLKADLGRFVKKGQMAPSEFKEYDCAALSAGFNKTTRAAFLKSFESRQVSADVTQIGVQGQTSPAFSKLSMKEKMALQKKGGVAALGGHEDDNDKKPKLQDDDDDNDKPSEMTGDDVKELLSKLKEIAEPVKSFRSALKEIEDELKSLQEENDEKEDDDE